jgi:hypothetical protein
VNQKGLLLAIIFFLFIAGATPQANAEGGGFETISNAFKYTYQWTADTVAEGKNWVKEQCPPNVYDLVVGKPEPSAVPPEVSKALEYEIKANTRELANCAKQTGVTVDTLETHVKSVLEKKRESENTLDAYTNQKATLRKAAQEISQIRALYETSYTMRALQIGAPLIGAFAGNELYKKLFARFFTAPANTRRTKIIIALQKTLEQKQMLELENVRLTTALASASKEEKTEIEATLTETQESATHLAYKIQKLQDALTHSGRPKYPAIARFANTVRALTAGVARIGCIATMACVSYWLTQKQIIERFELSPREMPAGLGQVLDAQSKAIDDLDARTDGTFEMYQKQIIDYQDSRKTVPLEVFSLLEKRDELDHNAARVWGDEVLASDKISELS